MSDPAALPAEPFGQAYLDWKSWDAGNFGALPTQARQYYAAEMRRTKLDGKRNLDVLEIGFGHGAFLAFAEQNGWKVTGTEVNEGLAAAARAKGYKVHLGESLDGLAGGSFDLVTAFDVMEHIPQDKIAGFIADAMRVLRTDGVFLARFPNGDSPFGLINQNGDVTHVTTIGSEKARYFANVIGAEILYLGGEARLGGKSLPATAGGALAATYLAIVLPLRTLINLVINIVFFARLRVAFCSTNLVMILKAPIRRDLQAVHAAESAR